MESPSSTIEVKLDYITRDIKEIKSDVKEMKSDYVPRREFETRFNEQEEKLSGLVKSEVALINEKIKNPLRAMYATAATVLSAVLYAVLKLVHL